MSRRPIPTSELAAQLFELGVTPGGVLLVHTAFSRVGPVEDGPPGLIRALRAAVGPRGTLVMPSMSDDDERPFDLRSTPCSGMGIVAETFWRMPDVLRSDSPHAFAAMGPKAPQIVADHPPDVPHGLDSPVGRVYELDGQVLLLGAGHDANTTIHLGEFLAGVPYRRPKSLALLERGQVVRLAYEEIDHCCEKFALVDEWLDEAGMQRRGRVGYGQARLARARDVVAVAVERLRGNETVFLHEPGVDAECDEARASISATGPRSEAGRHHGAPASREDPVARPAPLRHHDQPHRSTVGGDVSHIGIVQGIYQAFGRGDVPAILADLAPDVVWEYGINSTDVPWLQPGRGRDHVAGFFQSLAALDIHKFLPKTLLESGNVVVVLLDLEGTVRSTGRRIVEEDEVHIWYFDDTGKVTKFRHRADTHQHWAAFSKR